MEDLYKKQENRTILHNFAENRKKILSICIVGILRKEGDFLYHWLNHESDVIIYYTL